MANSSVIKTENMLKREAIKSQLIRARAEKLRVKNSIRTAATSFLSSGSKGTPSLMEHSKIQVHGENDEDENETMSIHQIKNPKYSN